MSTEILILFYIFVYLVLMVFSTIILAKYIQYRKKLKLSMIIWEFDENNVDSQFLIVFTIILPFISIPIIMILYIWVNILYDN